MTAIKKYLRLLDRSPIRRAAIPGLLFLLLCAFTYFSFFFDAQLSDIIAREASAYNGARVDIGSVSSHLWQGMLDLEDVQITNPVRPMENLFRLDHVHFTFLPSLLFRKKLFVQTMTVQGIRYGDPRKASGALPEYAGLGLIERAVPGLVPHLLHEDESNPLRHISKLTGPLDLEAGVARLSSQLQSLKKIEALNTSIDQAMGLADRSLRAPASEQGPDKVDLQHEMTLLRDEEASIDGLIDQDVAFLRRKLGVPEATEDLTHALFRPKVLSILERIAYWVDLSRRRMPAGSQLGEISWSRQATASGTMVHFGKSGGYPAFLIRSATFLSDPVPGTHLGRVRGSLAQLSTDPTICGSPTSFDLDADFPESDLQGLHFSALINHLHEPLTESFKLTVASFQARNVSLTETGDVALNLKRGVGDLFVEGKFFREGMRLDGRVTLENVELGVRTDQKQLEDAFLPLLETVTSLEVRSHAEGNITKVDLSVDSQFGKDLARGLWDHFRYDQIAIDDNLHRQVTERVDDPREKLNSRLAQLERQLAAQGASSRARPASNTDE